MPLRRWRFCVKTIVIVSGGMDSVTLAFKLAAKGHDLYVLAFDYGQRHRKELMFAAMCAEQLDAKFSLVDLSHLGRLLPGSALTDKSVLVPDGHYEADSMAVTIVPNRNAIMLSIAAGIAVANDVDTVAIGIHAGDHAIYPDCRLDFLIAFEKMVRLATDTDLAVIAPFVNKRKCDIVKEGESLGVSWLHTWSCYKGGHLHCGTCGTCIERQEAFQLSGVNDPTIYMSR